MIEFSRLWAFALLPLPLLAWWLLPALPARAAMRLPAGLWTFMDSIARSGSGRIPRLPRGLLLRGLGWVSLVAALAGPFMHGAALQSPSGRDLLIAVDLSASMARDAAEADGKTAPTIDTVRRLVRDFVARRRGDRIGLIAFASEAYLVAPLTFDAEAVIRTLDEISVGLPGRRTDLGQAIGLAVRLLRRQPSEERVLVLLSDGETNAGDIAALDAAALAHAGRITIHTIGFVDGSESDGASPLEAVATATGGRYFAATSLAQLQAAHLEIDRLTPGSARTDRLSHDLTWAPLSLSLLLVLAIGWREMREP